jgi:hypothetical protein
LSRVNIIGVERECCAEKGEKRLPRKKRDSLDVVGFINAAISNIPVTLSLYLVNYHFARTILQRI